MHRLHPIRWIACTLAIAAFAPARHLAAQTASTDSVPTIDASELTMRVPVINQDEVNRVIAHQFAHVGDLGSGAVTISFVVDETGKTTDVQVATSSGSERMDRAAQAVVREMRYTPPVKDGHPVRVRLSMPISFQPAPG